MPSQVDIVNHALALLGEPKITGLEEESEAARTAKAVFGLTLEAELQANAWGFATKRAKIAAAAIPPEWGYDYSYPLPADCLTLQFVEGQQYSQDLSVLTEGKERYRIEGQSIVTDIEGPLQITYTVMVTDPNKWDAGFRFAMALKLADSMCIAITQNTTKKQFLAAQYEDAIRRAMQRTAIQSPPTVPRTTSWLESRL